ncbi:NUDIX hydrolase domain-like protein [Apodospora peruviana]|uniref:NUDIX hydrolase domain-like protein n=1 Tax=Apodospora peruviana TaxID=516989 RepID=A0AAE0HZQ6_9PEZI|nr:NUDIX hydrolase domain-like protein [Apodospora peruviana]
MSNPHARAEAGAIGFEKPLEALSVTLQTYLANNPPVACVIVSAVVVHNSRVLLVQRAATDGYPLAWENPGGTVDADDETLLHALGRELREETGLKMTRVLALVDDATEFEGREGIWRKITCLVEVEPNSDDGEKPPLVVLEPSEHQDYVWASEADLDAGIVDGRPIKFAYEAQRKTTAVAFQIIKERGL